MGADGVLRTPEELGDEPFDASGYSNGYSGHGVGGYKKDPFGKSGAANFNATYE
jgi:hypothetical protein